MRGLYVLMIASLVAAGMSCSPDGEGWDYRLAIRKDMESKLKPDCPFGKHPEERCLKERVAEECSLTCEWDTIKCAPRQHLATRCPAGMRGKPCPQVCKNDSVVCWTGQRHVNRCKDGTIDESCPEVCE